MFQVLVVKKNYKKNFIQNNQTILDNILLKLFARILIQEPEKYQNTFIIPRGDRPTTRKYVSEGILQHNIKNNKFMSLSLVAISNTDIKLILCARGKKIG